MSQPNICIPPPLSILDSENLSHPRHRGLRAPRPHLRLPKRRRGKQRAAARETARGRGTRRSAAMTALGRRPRQVSAGIPGRLRRRRLARAEPRQDQAHPGGARAGFDGIAYAAHEGTPPLALLGMLGETMRNCVACHQTYRLAAE